MLSALAGESPAAEGLVPGVVWVSDMPADAWDPSLAAPNASSDTVWACDLFDSLSEWERQLAADRAADAYATARLGTIRDLERQIARLQGEQLCEIAALVRRAEQQAAEDTIRAKVHDRVADARRSAYAQVGLTLGVAERTGDARVDEALDLTERLSDTLFAVHRGTITLAKARALAESTIGLSEEETALVEARVLPKAAGLTPGALRRTARREALRVNKDAARKRAKAARAARTVELRPGTDGMCTLAAVLPLEEAVAVFGVVDTLAQAAKTALDPADRRGIGALRADALVDLVLRPGAQDRVSYDLAVVVPAGTLLGLGDEPGHLPGHGPIPADLARELAADATWRRLLTDPDTGHLLDLSPHRYQPPARLARWVRARDQHCRWPGCRRPGHRSEIDHTVEFSIGAHTVRFNLSVLCRKHHAVKHLPGWDLIQDPGGTGELVIVTPAGERYRTRPPTPTGVEQPVEVVPPAPQPEDPPPF